MFWIGLIIGAVIAVAALVGYAWLACWVTFRSWETFNSMVDVISDATENRKSEVCVYHNDELLNVAIFEEL